MLVERPKVRLIVEAAVKEIRDKGVEPTVSDILWLAHHAEQRCQPNKADPLDDFHLPVKCGRAKLYRLTVAGDVWLRECASKWWPRPDHNWMAMFAELYVLAHAGNKRIMRSIWDKKKARRRILFWASTHLPVSDKKIGRALYTLAGNVDYEEITDEKLIRPRADVDPFDWGEEIAVLCAVYKEKSPEHFLFDVSIHQCRRMMKNAALAMGRPDLAADDNSTDEAFGKFRLVVKNIIANGKKSEDG